MDQQRKIIWRMRPVAMLLLRLMDHMQYRMLFRLA
jgi:hypothetical protein